MIIEIYIIQINMPKKFVGENSKAVAARARKAAVKEAESIKKAKQEEDKAWEDNDKQVLKKKQKQVGIINVINVENKKNNCRYESCNVHFITYRKKLRRNVNSN